VSAAAMLHPDLKVFSPTQFSIGDTRFRVVTEDYHKHKTTADEVVLLKDLRWFEYYAELIHDANVRNLFELGIFEGGSALLFALLFDWLRVVAIDLRPPDAAVLAHLKRLGLENRVKLYYGTSQDNRKALERAAKEGFGETPFDMVVDDCSHVYELTRASFEILFPGLRHQGVYVIEDWAWAHWEGTFQHEQWIDQPAMSNLAFELTMLVGSRYDMLERLDIRHGTITAFKSAVQPLSDFRLADAYRMRGKTLPLI
jgi:predicted O-methyltransferase YrrM